MQIISSTITSNREGIIGDALRSVSAWIDLCLIVDLGITDNTLGVAREIVGDRLRVVKYEGPDDTSAHRNLGLDECARLGGDFALTLDTDERADDLHGLDPHDELARVPVETGTVICPMDSGRYAKERFLRLPAKDKYEGPCHECIVPRNTGQATLHHIGFWELPKTAERYQEKFEKATRQLQKATADDPGNPRWWYYLGDSLAGLGRDEEAIKAFDQCSCLWGWDEESAWACFRMALLLEKLGQRRQAMLVLASGMVRHPGIAELPWLAGELSLRAGRPDQAVYWARLAAANSTLHGESHFIRPRIGFRYPEGAKEGPFQLMAKAYEALGMQKEAAEAKGCLQEVAS